MTIKSGGIEYKMTETMAKAYLKARKGDELKMDPIKYLAKVINEEFGLLRNCVNVIPY